MECMGEKALKASFTQETNTKSVNSQGISDDIWCVTGDDFLIDDFFNLPNDEITLKNINEEGNFVVVEEEEDEEKCCNSSGSNGFVDDSARFTEDFTVPDDMQDLELWSHLMDDSSPDSMLVYPKPSIEANNKKTGFTFVNRVEPYRHPSVVRASFFPTAVPVKPRSKRSRSIVNRSWYTSSPPKTESSSSSSSPISTLLFSPPFHEMGMFYGHAKLPVKKPKRRPAPSFNGETGLSPSFQRRCSHCQVTKTPQWRAGPNGPKTLCNACGVRHKSGRLFPEYRPACSPMFSSDVHSNSHRKVLEMRRRKEVGEPSTDSAQLVQNGLKTE